MLCTLYALFHLILKPLYVKRQYHCSYSTNEEIEARDGDYIKITCNYCWI